MKNIISFLTDLEKNNNREWFQEYKHRYEEAKETLLLFIGNLIPQIKKFDDSLGDIQPKDTLFRIYRDVRFSKDKTPYKTNMGAIIADGGRKSKLAGYYLHIEPSESFLAGGVYCPAKEELQKIRNEIYYDPEKIKQILSKPEFNRYFPNLWEDKLSRPPKGFDKDFKDIDLLKYKSYVVSYKVDSKEINSSSFIDKAVKIYSTVFSLNNFINTSINS